MHQRWEIFISIPFVIYGWCVVFWEWVSSRGEIQGDFRLILYNMYEITFSKIFRLFQWAYSGLGKGYYHDFII
jgi:hypothetical protein